MLHFLLQAYEVSEKKYLYQLTSHVIRDFRRYWPMNANLYSILLANQAGVQWIPRTPISIQEGFELDAEPASSIAGFFQKLQSGPYWELKPPLLLSLLGRILFIKILYRYSSCHKANSFSTWNKNITIVQRFLKNPVSTWHVCETTIVYFSTL